MTNWERFVFTFFNTKVMADYLPKIVEGFILTVWLAASCGTLAVSSAAGGLAWLFAHALESIPSAPPIAAVAAAVAAAMVPAWAYGRLAQRRGEDVRDSLLDPVSARSSSS